LIKLLILGGTKFLGDDFVNELKGEDMEVHIASRRELESLFFHKIDRKNQAHLTDLILSTQYDLIVDFISYSMPDAAKLINAIRSKKGYSPFIIVISSTYVYGNPLYLAIDKEYNEGCFNPLEYDYINLNRPEVDYFEGKRSMESFLVKNYENLAIIRFPIILGANDYTDKTHYFSTVITAKNKVRFDVEYGLSNYIFSFEAAKFILTILKNRLAGIFNCALNDRLNQDDIFSIYCDFFNVSKEHFLVNSQAEGLLVKSPFYYSKNFIIDNTKQRNILDFGECFEKCLFRELSKSMP
jgi:nucleoside-diphosphate-sugar epimerase